ncbi:hypothetical protein QFC19_006006 [Naganishia cerealis]|uniref:Uncharacterized protein n=1 Tax=Naganishia cerealis TaxID=610337 RepID=A0ACC2VJR4_9TREE|nr:hypothetical protein QFC19_006006 [Naganishia cerealis]
MKFQLRKGNASSGKKGEGEAQVVASSGGSAKQALFNESGSESEDEFTAKIERKRQKVEEKVAQESHDWDLVSKRETTKESGLEKAQKSQGSKYMEGILNAKKQREKDEAENRQKLLEKQISRNSDMVVFESIKYREQMLGGTAQVKHRESTDTYGSQSHSNENLPVTEPDSQDVLLLLLEHIKEMIKSKVSPEELVAYKERYFQRIGQKT